jgi:hypothetical protein
MVRYEGIKKKRRLYVDAAGHQVPLDKRGGPSHYYMVASSGTLLSTGHLTVTGTEFSTDTVVTLGYNTVSSGTQSLSSVVTDGTVTFYGDASADFYYIAVNLTV